MARLIDADALMKYIRNHDYQLVSRMGCVDKGMFTDGIEHGINIQPTVDAVEVVRCKDCKHCLVTSSNSGGAAVCDRALPTRPLQDYFISGIGIFARVNPDDYCSHGERRTDG